MLPALSPSHQVGQQVHSFHNKYINLFFSVLVCNTPYVSLCIAIYMCASCKEHAVLVSSQSSQEDVTDKNAIKVLLYFAACVQIIFLQWYSEVG